MLQVVEPDRPATRPTIELDAQGRKIYRPDGEVLREFLRCRKHVSVIRGSIGSGTSTACIMKMWAISCEQARNSDGVRKTRWAVCRNTFPDLKNTTVKTWLDWFPEEVYGRFYWDRPFRHIIRIGDVDMEIIFLALDTEDDVRKLRSFEFTGIWFNELEFIEKAILDEAESRTGRYPAVKDGGATWDGVIADMNAPREDHFIPLMMGEVPIPDDWTEEERLAYQKPDNWGYHVQPPAMLEVKNAAGQLIGYRMNPKAENTKWLKPGYYAEKVKGKTKQWIDSRVLNKITVYVDGKPVWEQFSEDSHVSKEPLDPVPGWPVYVGLDFGRQPACVVGQLINNRWIIFSEAAARGVGASIFAPIVKQLLTKRLGTWFAVGGDREKNGYEVHFFGDPKGDDGTQSDETTAYDIFRSYGMPVRAAPVKNNHIQTRIEAVEYAMITMVNGNPRFLVCGTNCRTLKVACAGGYHFKRIKGTSRHEETPFKDRYSDIADATQYMLLGAGEGRAVTGGSHSGRKDPVSTRPAKKSRRRGGF
ncbi:hypothetical protein J2T08_000556 [Neorhizobium galegae]|uniref:hypothetical protein n=1 Tax=Neorhizobium galegae TaxID=399 RepID=UPI002789F363|nr:hypothetical protein [Neorhizobium galegae]MDQ0132655.1 hypothetical protein [Neorhizobium galegae]